MQDRDKHGKTYKGGAPRKLTLKGAKTIHRLRRNGWSVVDIADKYGIDRSMVYNIINGKSWKSSAEVV
jgi:DNA invertase Pin-like site-specific DNA recombinase